jgi:NAD(P)-dependent dehydrogenase (short-subunit alcohol dehydrogenase family)
MRHGAVVIGGTGAIGRVVVRQLVACGVPVVFTYAHRAHVADELLRESAGSDTTITALALDLAQPTASEQLVAAAESAVAEFDVVVNCAGRNIRQEMNDVTAADWNEVQVVNLFSVFETCRILGQHMAARGRGAIVTMSSTAAVRPLKRSPHYIAAKAGVLGLTQYLAACLAPRVIVNAVMPGLIATSTRDPGHDLDDMLGEIPLGRLGDVDSVARAVLFLGDPDMYITGQVITVDGGLTM